MTDLVHIGTLTHTPSGALATVTGLRAAGPAGAVLLTADSPAGATVSVFAVPAAGLASFHSQGPRDPEAPALSAVSPPPLPLMLNGQAHLLHLSVDSHAVVLSTAAGDGTPQTEIARVGAADPDGARTDRGLGQDLCHRRGGRLVVAERGGGDRDRGAGAPRSCF